MVEMETWIENHKGNPSEGISGDLLWPYIKPDAAKIVMLIADLFRGGR